MLQIASVLSERRSRCVEAIGLNSRGIAVRFRAKGGPAAFEYLFAGLGEEEYKALADQESLGRDGVRPLLLTHRPTRFARNTFLP